MSQDFGWSPTVSGIVQSSFFAGYMCTQIPGGYVVSKLGGRKVLPTGVSMWSAATAATPLLAGSLPGRTLHIDMQQAACNLTRSAALWFICQYMAIWPNTSVCKQHSGPSAVDSASSVWVESGSNGVATGSFAAAGCLRRMLSSGMVQNSDNCSSGRLTAGDLQGSCCAGSSWAWGRALLLHQPQTWSPPCLTRRSVPDPSGSFSQGSTSARWQGCWLRRF